MCIEVIKWLNTFWVYFIAIILTAAGWVFAIFHPINKSTENSQFLLNRIKKMRIWGRKCCTWSKYNCIILLCSHIERGDVYGKYTILPCDINNIECCLSSDSVKNVWNKRIGFMCMHIHIYEVVIEHTKRGRWCWWWCWYWDIRHRYCEILIYHFVLSDGLIKLRCLRHFSYSFNNKLIWRVWHMF